MGAYGTVRWTGRDEGRTLWAEGRRGSNQMSTASRAISVAACSLLLVAGAAVGHDGPIRTTVSATLAEVGGATLVKGELSSPKSSCVPRRLVKVLQAEAGTDTLIAKYKTNARGKWQVSLGASPEPGEYYGKATKRRIGPRDHRHLCKGATSNRLTVVATRPTVTIVSPEDGETRPSSAPIPFVGSASDPQDGDLTGSSIVWTSDLDGQIGTGESFSQSLSVGEHVITATATDSDDNTGTDTIGLTVAD